MRKMKILGATLFVVFVFSFNAFANPQLDAFKKRFTFVRKDGKLVEVRDNFLQSKKFGLRPLLEYFKRSISLEQSHMLASDQKEFEKEVRDLFIDPVSGLDETPDYLMDSLTQLKTLDVDYIFNHPKFKEVLARFEDKLDTEMAKLGLVVIARPYEAKFFFQRNLTYNIVKMALEFAAQQLGEVPVLNTAIYVIKEAERLFRERRTFHQNMLLHYLENFSEEDLGLTHEEANLVWSSIYESRITWYAFWDSNAAEANWDKFGTARFFQYMRMANTRFRDNRGNYTSIGKRVNFAFQDAVIKDKNVIINLFDKKNMFSRMESVAYYYDNPARVKTQRLLLQLGQLGLSFVSLPQFIKDFANSYMKSYYDQQRLTEGALIGYLESRGNTDFARSFLSQNVNPFEASLE